MSRNDRVTRVLLAGIALLLVANLLVNLNATPRALAAPGGIPDSGAQFQSMVDSLKELNAKVDKLDSFLESGDLSVKVKELPKADK